MGLVVSLIRHGKTRGNLEGRYVGHGNQGLCEEGVNALREYIQKGIYSSSEILYVSPLRRCLETAALIYPNHKPVIIEGLKEISFGDFEGKTYEEIEWPFGELWETVAFPNGESMIGFNRRIEKTFIEMINMTDADEITAICHGGVIMSIMRSVFGGEFYEWRVDNGLGFRFGFDTETKTGGKIRRIE